MTRPGDRPRLWLFALAGLLQGVAEFWRRASREELQRCEERGADWVGGLIRRLEFLMEDERAVLVRAVRCHRPVPGDRCSLAVAVADGLAAGRPPERERPEPAEPTSEPVRSVFTSVRMPGRPGPDAEWYHRTVPLPSGHSPRARWRQWMRVFPVRREKARVDYRGLWEDFSGAVERVHPEVWRDPEEAVSALLDLLAAYAWCLPAPAWRTDPDVSLCDHFRATAALAVCAAEQDDRTLETWAAGIREGAYPDEPVAVLVGGDLSGIQRFLYSVSSHGAIRSLRGRSFYLSMVLEAAVRLLLRELDLPPTQVICSSGGHFYLLAPLSCRGAVDGVARRVTEALLDVHGGDLALAVECVELRGVDFDVRAGGLAARWAELGRKLGDRKAGLFREFLPERHSAIVGPFGTGGLARRCDVCHGEESEIASGLARRVTEEEECWKCSLCASFEELGTVLARQPAWVAWRSGQCRTGRVATWRTVPAALGIEVFFGQEGSPIPGGASAMALRRASLDREEGRLSGFRWLPAHTPLEPGGPGRPDGSVASLHEICERARGAQYWACLRMDVDSLGTVFRQGLAGRSSLSRVAALSRMVVLFFEGFLPDLVAVSDGKEPGLYLVYAGGDDLLLVGRWDRVVEMAWRIRRRFARFVGRNPCLTLSAGVTLHRAKFPLYQAAEEAGEALETAKAFRRPRGWSKDAVAVFGAAVSWEDFAWLARWRNRLLPLLETSGAEGAGISRTLLQRLKSMADLSGRGVGILGAGRVSLDDAARAAGFHRACWRLVYTLARQPEGARARLVELQSEILEDPRRVALTGMLARWLELLTRRERAEVAWGR